MTKNVLQRVAQVGVVVMALAVLVTVGLSGVTGQATQPNQPKGLKLVAKSNVLWEGCWDEKLFGKRLELCARLTEEDAKFYLEFSWPAGTTRYELANGEGSFGVGPFTIKYKVSEVEITDGKLRSVRIKLQGCIGSLCRTLFNDKITFSYVGSTQEDSGVRYKYESDTEEKR
jgi:hypothetical protein